MTPGNVRATRMGVEGLSLRIPLGPLLRLVQQTKDNIPTPDEQLLHLNADKNGVGEDDLRIPGFWSCQGRPQHSRLPEAWPKDILLLYHLLISSAIRCILYMSLCHSSQFLQRERFRVGRCLTS